MLLHAAPRDLETVQIKERGFPERIKKASCAGRGPTGGLGENIGAPPPLGVISAKSPPGAGFPRSAGGGLGLAGLYIIIQLYSLLYTCFIPLCAWVSVCP